MDHLKQRSLRRLPELSEAQRSDPLFVRSIEKALQVMSAFHNADAPLTLSEIAARAGINRSAAQRMVHTLRELDYIQRDADDHGFRPGIHVLDHTLDFLRLDPLVRRATPILQELRRTVRERVDLSLFDDLRVVYAVRLQTKRQVFFTSLLGQSAPIFCTSGGLAILSCLPDDRVRDIIARSDRSAFTPQTLTDPAQIMAAVEKARAQGFAVTENQLLTGEVAIGFPILDKTRQPVAAIHVAGSIAEWSVEEFTQRCVPHCAEAASAISHL